MKLLHYLQYHYQFQNAIYKYILEQSCCVFKFSNTRYSIKFDFWGAYLLPRGLEVNDLGLVRQTK